MSFFIVAFLTLLAALPALGAVAVTQHRALRRLRRERDDCRADFVEQHRRAEHMHLAADYASDGILVLDPRGRVAWVNAAACRIMGRPEAEMLGQDPDAFAFPRRDRRGRRSFRVDPADPKSRRLHLFLNERADGTRFWNQVSVASRRGTDGTTHLVLVCRDVTEQIEKAEKLRETRAQLEHAARHDSLTGLANRDLLHRFAAEAAMSIPPGRFLGLLHLDLDRFKAINDTHGHAAGDAVLRHVATAISGALRRSDLVARIGGDEFVVVCPDLDGPDALAAVAGTLLTAIATPVETDGRSLTCHASIGGALTGPDDLGPQDLLNRSDIALYEAKRRGRGCFALYDDRLHARHVARARRAADLRAAIDGDGIRHRFQPIRDLSSGLICAFETRSRWDHDGAPVPPSQFLALAANLGLTAALDFRALDAALDLARALDAAGEGHVAVTVNASPALLDHPDLLDRVAAGLTARLLPPERLVVEIPESAILPDDDRGGEEDRIARLAQLAKLGVPVMIDAFGIGHGGLSRLAQLPVRAAKIDRSLVRQVLIDDNGARVLRTAAAICAGLGHRVIAEGVDQHALAIRLRNLGCDAVQGRWVAPPMPADRALRWIGAQKRPRQVRVARA